MTAVTQPATDDSERRVAPRTRTLKRAKILFNNRFSTFDCIVRNVSSTGALLTIDSAVPLPKSFEIRIGDEELIRPAKLVYRRELFAGIHFLDAADSEDAVAIGHDALAAAKAGNVADDLRITSAPLPRGLSSRFPWF